MNNGVFFLKDYGKVIITVKEVMRQRGITRNKLANLTGHSYNTINRYYQEGPMSSVDLDILAKICFVLDCEIKDVLKYEKA